MLLRDITYLKLWWHYCSGAAEPFEHFDRAHYEDHFYEIILNLDQLFRTRCCLKTSHFYSSFCLAEQNQLCNYSRGPNAEHFCEKEILIWTRGTRGNVV